MTFRPASHPFIWPWDCPHCPHLPTKAISSVISKSWVPALWNVFCPTPTTERFTVSPFSGTLKYCHPPQKSSFVRNLPCSAGDVDSVSGLSTRIPHERKKVKSLSCVRLFATPWTLGHHAPLSMEFSRQEYCSGLPFPSPHAMRQLSQCAEIFKQQGSDLPLLHSG